MALSIRGIVGICAVLLIVGYTFDFVRRCQFDDSGSTHLSPIVRLIFCWVGHVHSLVDAFGSGHVPMWYVNGRAKLAARNAPVRHFSSPFRVPDEPYPDNLVHTEFAWWRIIRLTLVDVIDFSMASWPNVAWNIVMHKDALIVTWVTAFQLAASLSTQAMYGRGVPAIVTFLNAAVIIICLKFIVDVVILGLWVVYVYRFDMHRYSRRLFGLPLAAACGFCLTLCASVIATGMLFNFMMLGLIVFCLVEFLSVWYSPFSMYDASAPTQLGLAYALLRSLLLLTIDYEVFRYILIFCSAVVKMVLPFDDNRFYYEVAVRNIIRLTVYSPVAQTSGFLVGLFACFTGAIMFAVMRGFVGYHSYHDRSPLTVSSIFTGFFHYMADFFLLFRMLPAMIRGDRFSVQKYACAWILTISFFYDLVYAKDVALCRMALHIFITIGYVSQRYAFVRMFNNQM